MPLRGKEIINQASKNSSRSPTGRSWLENGGTSIIRVSQSEWVSEFDNLGARSLSQRIDNFLDLSSSMPESEEYQVTNYGPGGHYNVHYDQSVILEHLNEKFENEGNIYGGRVATVSKDVELNDI